MDEILPKQSQPQKVMLPLSLRLIAYAYFVLPFINIIWNALSLKHFSLLKFMASFTFVGAILILSAPIIAIGLIREHDGLIYCSSPIALYL